MAATTSGVLFLKLYYERLWFLLQKPDAAKQSHLIPERATATKSNDATSSIATTAIQTTKPSLLSGSGIGNVTTAASSGAADITGSNLNTSTNDTNHVKTKAAIDNNSNKSTNASSGNLTNHNPTNVTTNMATSSPLITPKISSILEALDKEGNSMMAPDDPSPSTEEALPISLADAKKDAKAEDDAEAEDDVEAEDAESSFGKDEGHQSSKALDFSQMSNQQSKDILKDLSGEMSSGKASTTRSDGESKTPADRKSLSGGSNLSQMSSLELEELLGNMSYYQNSLT